jgi:hypothetical protein
MHTPIAQFHDAMLATQAIQELCGLSFQPNDFDASGDGRLSQADWATVLDIRSSGSSSLLEGEDEPEIILSSTRPICLKGA